MEPRDEGREAYFAGKEVFDCPYQDGSKQYWEWVGSWRDAGERHVLAGGSPPSRGNPVDPLD